jgi:hypothetical protein
MDLTLSRHFLRHALRLTLVRGFAVETCSLAGRLVSQPRLISIRGLFAAVRCAFDPCSIFVLNSFDTRLICYGK